MPRKALLTAPTDNDAQVPPEADGIFPVVPLREIAAWRTKLHQRFGFGKGAFKSLDDTPGDQ